MVSPGEHVPTADQRIVLLMSPSTEHERLASCIGRLVEVFADETATFLDRPTVQAAKRDFRAALVATLGR